MAVRAAAGPGVAPGHGSSRGFRRSRRGRMPVAAKEASQQPVMLVMVRGRRASEGRPERGLASILFPVVHLLEKLFGLLLVHEGEPRQALLQLKGVKEDAVLVIAPCVKNLLVPYDPSISGRDIHHLQPVCVADEVIRQHDGALQTGVGPSRLVGIGDVEPRDGDGLDLVGGLGHEALDRLLVVIG